MTEQEINNLIDSKIGKTKMSQLPEATQTSGLYSIGYTGNQSVKYKASLLQGDPLTVRKTYQTEAEALADKNPIDATTSLPLTVGQFVSIVDDGEKNGIYRIGSISGDGTMSLELQGKLGDMSEYAKTDDIFDKISNSTFEVKLKAELTFEKTINSAGALTSSTTAWGATVNFIPIDGADTVRYTGRAGFVSSPAVAFYKDKTEDSFIEGYPKTSIEVLDEVITVPTGANYMRAVCTALYKDSFSLTLYNATPSASRYASLEDVLSNLKKSEFEKGFINHELSANQGDYIDDIKYIDDIIIINPTPDSVYTLLQFSNSRITIRKNGVNYAELFANRIPSNRIGYGWYLVAIYSNGLTDGEQVYIKTNPTLLPSATKSFKGDGLIISDRRFMYSDDLSVSDRILKLPFESKYFGQYLEIINTVLKGIYIEGIKGEDLKLTDFQLKSDGDFTFQLRTAVDNIQVIRPTVVAISNEVQEFRGTGAYANVVVYMLIDWDKLPSEKIGVDLAALNRPILSNNVNNPELSPLIQRHILKNSSSGGGSMLPYSGNIVKDPLFTNAQKWLDPTQDVYAELTESNGFAEIVLDETLGVNVLRHTKFAPSDFNPSPNIKFNNLFRKNFKEGDLIRVRGKVYHDIGDRAQSNANVYLFINKTGAYPSGSDVRLSSTLVSLTNKTWTEFEVVTELQEDTNADNMSIRIRAASDNATVNENQSIAVTDISIEFTTKENPFPPETTKIGVMYQQQEIVKAVVNMLKSDEAFIDNLTMRSINTYAKGADVFFEKVRTLITQTEILRLKDSIRKPSMDGYHLVVREGVLYFYDNGVEHKITIE